MMGLLYDKYILRQDDKGKIVEKAQFTSVNEYFETISNADIAGKDDSYKNLMYFDKVIY